MGSSSNPESMPSSTPAAPTNSSFCQRKRSESGSFMSNLRYHFHEFIHSSMDEHKTCIKTAFQKTYYRLKMSVGGLIEPSPTEGGNAPAVPPTAAGERTAAAK